jgi:sugar lactone lactonase YvrE
LVVWSGKFDGTPFNAKGYGRDHIPWGFSMFMSGGGVTTAHVIGRTDVIGLRASERMCTCPFARDYFRVSGSRSSQSDLSPQRPLRAADDRQRRNRSRGSGLPQSMRYALLSLFGLTLLWSQSTRTIAGTGVAGFSGDGGPGEKAQVNNPYGLATGPDDALYFCEIGNHRVRRLDLKTHVISTVAGNGEKGYLGDGGPAIAASLNEPYEIRFDEHGNMYFAEMQNHVVRRVDAKTKVISTVAGVGRPGFEGDGGPATKALLRQPHSIAFDGFGGLLICDIGNLRIRRVDLKTGMIGTWSGTGEKKPTPDGAPLGGTPLNGPRAITAGRNGEFFLVLREGNAVYRIDAATARIYHLAGTGETGYSGDGGSAKVARFAGPKGIAWSPDHSLYLADTENHVIRRIDLTSGIITTVVGTGQRGNGPDGRARECWLSRPHGIFVDPAGKVFIADSESHRIRALE